MVIPGETHILAINAGSCSIKFGLFKLNAALTPVFNGEIRDFGSIHSCFIVHGDASTDALERTFAIPDRVTAVEVLMEWLVERLAPSSLAAIAHRVVHGGAHRAPSRPIDKALLASLYDSVTADPDHLPQELHLIEELHRNFPGVAQIACFDSAFHSAMPPVASIIPIPRRYYDAGIRRFGFHGLSCAYLMKQLANLVDTQAAAGKVVLAHLGGGASITAVEGGQGRDTTMGLTPAGGIPMGSRSGDLDPGIAWYCSRKDQMTPAQFNHMVNHESGLLGVSGTSGDLRQLLSDAPGDAHAAEAVALFCYQARKAICAMAGAIDGVDTLIFTGGIGENSAAARARICAGLAHIGVRIDEPSNLINAAVISADASAVKVLIIRTDEQWMIAEEARLMLFMP
ncbi:acetate kinase [Janthinobacterium sp. ROICE36]|uniref:acetate/propionate family kinase n=1 Tax=Janthinobacterium sp. ROICE36 TaxID=2048670 RepID=UPI000C7EC6C5|nr:acetate/propionate family kinase [Janthinobacterium sp. ROICE36]PLY39796.1 acetate kinase [Janthinobacterium sp. ROICE36]